jgi:predicted ATPase
MKNKTIRLAFTGGPCCGKTTLLESLAQMGHQIVPEAARMIIEEEQQRDSEYLPWRNLYEFQKKVAKTLLELEHSFDSKLLFCDRGILDGHAYAQHGKVQTPEIITLTAFGRYQQVFILKPLNIYKTDESRKESREEALKVHHQIHRAYLDFGYLPRNIPALGIRERAEYVGRLVSGGE